MMIIAQWARTRITFSMGDMPGRMLEHWAMVWKQQIIRVIGTICEKTLR